MANILSDLFGTSGQQDQLSRIAQQQQDIASGQQKVGKRLEQPLLTGALPGPADALVKQTLQSNVANLGNVFARLGLTGSTMEAGGINTANLQSLAQTFGIQEDMFKLGLPSIHEALGGLSGASGTVNDIANLNLSETNDLMKFISSFGQAMGKGMAG